MSEPNSNPPTEAVAALSVDSTTHATAGAASNQVVTPWEVSADAAIDYDRLITEFGCSRIDDSLRDKLTMLADRRGMPLHRWIRRGIFFSHRDLDRLMENLIPSAPTDPAAKPTVQRPVFLYTGRGPSSESMHLGHLVPFMMTQYMQALLDCPLVIQLTDDEKFLWKDKLTLAETTRLAHENSKDILACNFSYEKTFLFTNTDYIQHLYPTVLSINKHTNMNNIKSIFGLTDRDAAGKMGFPAIQAAPCFVSSFAPQVFSAEYAKKNPLCLVPCAIDQDPYFRLTRDVAPKLKCPKPVLMHASFFPALQGPNSKMSASNENSAIYLTDTPDQIKKKINRYAFSGGGRTMEEQREKGANLEVDVPYQWLRFFMEDDEKLAEIATRYGQGEMLTGEVKKICIDEVTKVVLTHQEARAKVTGDMVKDFMKIRHVA